MPTADLDSLPPEALRALTRLPGWSDDRLERVEKLDSGLSNQSFRIVAGSRDVVVRIPVNGDRPARLSWARELELLRILGRARIAPPLDYLDTDTGVCITHTIHGRHWSPKEARAPDNMQRLANKLRTLHELELDLPRYQPWTAARDYLQQLEPLDPELRSHAAELEHLAREHQDRRQPRQPCHNDLMLANIIDDGELWLLDWEYAALGDPIFDLASVAVFCEFDESASRDWLKSYTENPPARSSFQRSGRLVLLLALFWALRERQISPDAQHERFANWAIQQLQQLATT